LPPAAGPACGRCRRGLSPFARGASLGPYEGALRLVLHELKYRGRRRAAGRLARALLESPAALAVLEPGVLLVPVPLHPRRRRERTFNQAELLAMALGGGRSLPVCRDALVRLKDTPAQTGLSAAARRRNVEGAFAVRRPARVAGRVVVLVDDVLTTGATTRACATALRRAGAAEVRLLTVARVA
jgi:ComF family protein